MRCKIAALLTQKAFRVIAVATWLYSIPLMGLVAANAGPWWGLFSGFVVAPAFAVMIGVLATDKVDRPRALDWENDVFRRDTPSESIEGSDVREEVRLAA